MPYSAPGPFLGAQTASAYQVSRSLRFRSSASAYLTRTYSSSPTSSTKQTFSAWVKRGKLDASSTDYVIFGGYDGSSGISNFIQFRYDTFRVASGTTGDVATTAIYRDPSAWYHIVVGMDTTQATASNRILMYVNGTQITSFSSSTYPAQNAVLQFAMANANNKIGSFYNGGGGYFDGYLAEVNFIDGQALTPSSFGAFDTNGVWQPAKYTGSYGTNGFYLNFSDNSGATATTIGKDSSGNSNNWTPNNISVTSGTTYDSMIDSPTNYADGGNGRGNYAVLNPLYTYGGPTVSNGNLTVLSSASQSSASGTIGVNSGKYYAEFKPSNVGNNPSFGVFALGGNTNGANVGSGQSSRIIYSSNGSVYTTAVAATYATYTASNTIGVALDMDGSTVTFYKDNVSQGSISVPSGYSNWTFAVLMNGGTDGGDVNFGQRPFTYTPPSGFSALNTQNLPTPTIAAGNKYFDALLYTGANPNAAKTVTGLGFQPDFVWIKSRVTGYGHGLFDVARGVNKRLQTDTTGAEATSSTYLTAFNSDGFSLGTDYGQNAPSEPYVSWNWKGSNGTSSIAVNAYGSTPSIASTVSANTSAGFSVVTYTGNGTTGATVGHGLGVAPSMVIVKERGNTNGWYVYHASLGNTKCVYLDSTSAQATVSIWNNSTPTSSVITYNNGVEVNRSSGTYVAYCFAPVAGYSAFGSYTGNGSTDGPFIFTGFRPRWVICKRADSTSDWIINDTTRDAYNNTSKRLFANDPGVESGTYDSMDILSNGIKMRNSNSINISGGTFIYAAFAENPFKTSRAR